ncbi:hypothetical protein BDY19DRAFT_186558 [Irpex rosettiformis]|uniref:Uncharacterized protein n=1 Tax=Irpex rosettiformis TaxID=378272 RepID=A0ACB8U1Y2_9APHY|nr:hypothetical protein BDY19DRAFT_186558 [Irpex rosettiformis]
MSSSSPLNSTRSAQLSERQTIAMDVSGTDYMRSNLTAEPVAEGKKRTSTTPPQTDNVMTDNPHTKKQKLTCPGPAFPCEDKRKTLASRLLAKEPASLRRALSLRSEASVTDTFDDSVLPAESTSTQLDEESTLDCAQGLVVFKNSKNSFAGALPVASGGTVTVAQTEPCSPLPDSLTNKSVRPEPLPAIAPPPFEQIPRAPLTSSEVAEARIKALVKKDWEERLADGLSVVSTFLMSNNKQIYTEGPGEKRPVEHEEQEIRLSRSSSSSDADEDLAPKLGIRESFRLRIMQWMLDYLRHPALSLSYALTCGSNFWSLMILGGTPLTCLLAISSVLALLQPAHRKSSKKIAEVVLLMATLIRLVF